MVAADALAPNTRIKPSESTALAPLIHGTMYSSIQQFYIEWQLFNKQKRLKRNDRNIQKGRRTQWFLWKNWVALTKNCNTPLRKTTDHGYHSNPCVVPHPVTLAPVCDAVSMRTSDFYKGGSWYKPIPGCRLPVPIVSLKRYLVSGVQPFPAQITHFLHC